MAADPRRFLPLRTSRHKKLTNLDHLKYRPEIDGLRALAVLPVILFHHGYEWIRGGFGGVDVFFVISGYLISLIILKKEYAGEFSIKDFWLRRARRILPALSGVVAACMALGFFLLFRMDWKPLGDQGLSVFSMLANFKMRALTGNYWGPNTSEIPLLHTWSLAVEEQFYLFYPFVLILLARKFKDRATHVIILGGVISFVIGITLTRVAPAAAFYLLPSRAWELAAGSILAFLSYRRSAGFCQYRFANLFSIIGLCLVVASYFFIDEKRGFPGWQAILPVTGSVAVLAFTAKDRLVGRLLCVRPLRYIGEISYSLYLWHWPVIVYHHLLSLQSNAVAPKLLLILISVILAVVSYHLVEKPIRFSANGNKYVVGMALVGLGSSAMLYLWPIHYDFTSFSPTVWKGRVYDVTPTQHPWDAFMTNRMEGITVPQRDENPSSRFTNEGFLKKYGGPAPEVVVLGDSHALMWCGTIDSICQDLGLTVSFFAADGTSPSISVPPVELSTRFFSGHEKFLWDSARLRAIDQKPKVVIVATPYSYNRNGEELDKLVKIIERGGSKCLFIEQPPLLPIGDKNALAYCADFVRKYGKQSEIRLRPGEPQKWQAGKKILEDLCLKNDSAKMIQVSDLFFTNDGDVVMMEDSHLLYIDDDHLSEYGAQKAKERIRNSLMKAVGRID